MIIFQLYYIVDVWKRYVVNDITQANIVIASYNLFKLADI